MAPRFQTMSKRGWRLLLCGSALVLVAACGSDYERDMRSVERFAKRTQIGSSQDVWLEMYNFAGEWERVALVFGYADDYAACEDIRRGLEDQFVRDYRCTVVNE